MEREHAGAAVYGVVVGQQCIVGGVDYGSADPRTGTGNDEHPNRSRGTRHDREHCPDHGTYKSNNYSIAFVGSYCNGHLHEQRAQSGQSD
ncbi:unannotated protein [freshwater metagenome]|uniref:Unannotated protein n=1 Tax=freshwater metagenome TaxID=449393 RepID=A0A6J7G9H6_9ZZZZ